MGGVYVQIHQYFTKAQGSDLCDFGNVLVVLKILKVRVLGKDDKKLVRAHWKTPDKGKAPLIWDLMKSFERPGERCSGLMKSF